LRNFSRGIDERPVIPVRAPAKSYGEQETFAADTTDEEFLEATVRRMADKLMAKVREDGKSIRTLTVKVRYNDMDEEQASESLLEPTQLETETYAKVCALLRKAWRRRVSLRLVSLKLSNVYEDVFRGNLALDIASRQHAAQERLTHTVDQLRQKYGRAVVQRGHDFTLRAKNGRGQEPVTADASLAPGAVSKARGKSEKTLSSGPNPLEPHRQSGPASRPAGSLPGNSKTAAGLPANPTAPHNLAFVQRQRIGNSFARVTASPGPELRFRIEASPPQLPTARSRRSTTYVPLNVHSYYTFLDSTLSTKAVVELAKRQELPAIALTDKNNLHGAVEFAQWAAAAGIKPLIGTELDWLGHRLCLYAQTQNGYHNLCRILNRVCGSARKTGNDKRPQIHKHPAFPQTENGAGLEREFEQFNTDDLLAVSSDFKLARFFPNRFYQEINSIEAWEKRSASLPCVASFPVHYEMPSDRWQYDIVQSIRTLTLLRQQHPEKRLDGDYHFRSVAEMKQLFAAHTELLAHTVEIAERCSFTISPGKPQFPPYHPEGTTAAAYLRRLAMNGLRQRYPDDHARIRPQLEEELAIILEVGYEEYFLIMWDILQECRRRGIDWITRGSAADSLACYCLEISDVCPVRFDLYFRRFLNQERMALNKLPDIDVDFPHDRKDDVIDLIFEKYGPDRAAVVGGFSTFQSRSAFAEIAKVLGVSEFQVRRLTERLPHFSRASELAEVANDTLECRDLPLDQEPYSTALRMAQFLDGFPRYPKMHPCGVVLSRQRMDEITPCFISAKGYPTTHLDMDSVEAVGLIKMDILAQGGLAVMRDVREMIQKPTREAGQFPCPVTASQAETDNGRLNETSTGYAVAANGVVLNGDQRFSGCAEERSLIEQLPSTSGPFDDPQVWDLIADGGARAVHHIESPAMISLCKMCNVRDIDTLIAIVSVIRPGAANESKKMEFARRYQGLSPVHYPHPSLESSLRSTYGLVVYEEHILQMCEAFAGLPPGRADILRRALAKEKTELIDQIQTEFIACAQKLGRAGDEITEVWNLVTGFRGYAFCKAHSTAYGVEAYQSAWLKLHFPAEFMAAVLTNGKGFYSPLVYILECHRLGIPLLPPSINEPGPGFSIGHNAEPSRRNGITAPHSHRAIRVPMLLVKGLTQRTKEIIQRERARGAFTSLTDFLLRVQPLAEEMEALIRVGSFDEFGQSRTAQYWSWRAGANSGGAGRPAQTESNLAGVSSTHQLWLLTPGDLDRLPSAPLVEPTRLQRLQAEEELLGYPVSGHPLELFPDIAWDTYCPVNRVGEHLGEQIVTCGLVIEQRLFHQVTGEPMKFLTIADWTGIIETELFARTYQSYGLNTIRYRVLEITATVEPYENHRGHTLRVLRAGKPRRMRT
jgi:DNA-directed DNA polymerase III PolC